MKKILIKAAFTLFLIITMPLPVQANSGTGSAPVPRPNAPVIETRYRFVDGSLYSRKYDTTNNIWYGNWKCTEDAATQNGVNLTFKKLKRLPGNKVKLVWTRSDYVDGYEIYRKGLKQFKKIKTVIPERGYCRNRNLKYGVTYIYKIRAYKIIDGEIYYSKFSSKKRILL